MDEMGKVLKHWAMVGAEYAKTFEACCEKYGSPAGRLDAAWLQRLDQEDRSALQKLDAAMITAEVALGRALEE